MPDEDEEETGPEEWGWRGGTYGCSSTKLLALYTLS